MMHHNLTISLNTYFPIDINIALLLNFTNLLSILCCFCHNACHALSLPWVTSSQPPGLMVMVVQEFDLRTS